MVEPVAASEVAKHGHGVATLLQEAEERGTSRVPVTSSTRTVEDPLTSVLLDCSQHLTNEAHNFHRTRVRDQAKTGIYSRTRRCMEVLYF